MSAAASACCDPCERNPRNRASIMELLPQEAGGSPEKPARPVLIQPVVGAYQERWPPDTTMTVSPIPLCLTNANSEAAFAGCSLMQPCEAGPPRRWIS